MLDTVRSSDFMGEGFGENTHERTHHLNFLNPIDSTSFFHLTKLPLLTYPLIIEELRPKDTLPGASYSPHRGS